MITDKKWTGADPKLYPELVQASVDLWNVSDKSKYEDCYLVDVEEMEKFTDVLQKVMESVHKGES